MSVGFKTPVTSSNVNAAFMSRTENTSTVGQVDLQNVDAVSGGSLSNIQRIINGYATFMGTNAAAMTFDEAPNWTSNNLGAVNDTLFLRIDAIDAAFSNLAPYLPIASASTAGIVSTVSQTFAGDKTFQDSIEAQSEFYINSQQDNTTTGATGVLNTPTNVIYQVKNAGLTGIAGIGEPTKDQFVIVTNLTGSAVNIAHLENTANTDIDTGTGDDITLENDASLNLYYDLQNLVWRVVGGSGGGSGADLSSNFEYGLTVDSTTTGSSAAIPNPTTPIVELTNGTLTSVNNFYAGSEGRSHIIVNRTGASITILDDVGGTAANRFSLPDGDFTLEDNQAMEVYYSSNESRWLMVGAEGGVGLTNPMTTEGDLILGGTAGTPTRLGIGADKTVLQSDGTDASWGPVLDSGSYVATITDGLNIDSSSFREAFYTRIGNIVNVTLFVTIDPTAASGNPTTITMSLPVSVSGNFPDANGGFGNGSTSASSSGDVQCGNVFSTSGAQTMTYRFNAQRGGSSSHALNFMYEIF